VKIDTSGGEPQRPSILLRVANKRAAKWKAQILRESAERVSLSANLGEGETRVAEKAATQTELVFASDAMRVEQRVCPTKWTL